MLYLDHCGSTPLAHTVKRRMIDFINQDIYGNPAASHHVVGRQAANAVANAREQIAKCVNANVKEIIFTSGATEANNLVLWGFANRYRAQKCHIIYGATEHKSIFDTALFMGRSVDAGGASPEENITQETLEGVTVQSAIVNRDGTIDLRYLEQALSSTRDVPTLVAIMHTNNEIPARNPVEDIANLCKKYGAFFHCDGVQGFVREKLDFGSGTYGSYVISTHKIYGPKGCGVLVLGSNPLSPRLNPPYHGGDHEYGIRPGTLNTLAIVGGSESIVLHENLRESRARHLRRCAETFVNYLQNHAPNFHLTVPLDPRASGIVNFYFENVEAQSLLNKLSDVCLNRGASCLGAGGERFSHVPQALGLPLEVQANVLRASFGDAIAVENVEAAAQEIVKAL